MLYFKCLPLTNLRKSYMRIALFHVEVTQTQVTSEQKLQNNRKSILDGPNLQDFIRLSSESKSQLVSDTTKGLSTSSSIHKLKFFMETYGCQMNENDSDIVRSILQSASYESVNSIQEADIILTNTCAIRANAETKVFERLKYFNHLKELRRLKLPKHIRASANMTKQYPMVAVLGCMAERLKESLFQESSVDIVVGPDAYRDLPRLIDLAISSSTGEVNQRAANLQLSLDETYADIQPIRDPTSVPSIAFVSIMRGCNNMCSFCIVPFTRGRERSRPLKSIIDEITDLVYNKNVREVTLLGQNVNGFHDTSPESAIEYPANRPYTATKGFNNLFHSRKKDLPGARFIDLLDRVSQIHPELRVRFTSPHPKDFPEEVLHLIANRPNICSSIHMPVQSGSTSVLKRMRRGYSRESYIELIDRSKHIIPNIRFSTDIITGFCDESEEEHQETLSLLDYVKYDAAFMFAYSLRDKTHAAHVMEDNIPEDIKLRRLQEVIQKFQSNLHQFNEKYEVNQYRLVLVEGYAAKPSIEGFDFLTGRCDSNKRVVFPISSLICTSMESYQSLNYKSQEFNNNIDLVNNQTKHTELFYYHQQYQNYLDLHRQQLNSHVSCIEDFQSLFGKYIIVKVVKANGPTLRGYPIAISSISECSRLKCTM